VTGQGAIAWLVTHPEVVVDPAVPVPRWGLSLRGIERMRSFAASPELAGLSAIWASAEAKAIEAAGLLGARWGLGASVHEGLGENDRSSTGFVPEPEFSRLAEAFLARPDESVRGWERAVDAQARIAAAVEEILAAHGGGGDVVFVAHGGVGTLLLARYLRCPIPEAPRPGGMGWCWRFRIATREVLNPASPWCSIGRSIAPA
jgi:broad specificity phosphatase PhoE